MINSASIGEILAEGTMALRSSPELSGHSKEIDAFMHNFIKTEGLPTLVKFLGKVDQEERLNLLNLVMKSCAPEDFPLENKKLWHGLVSVVQHTLAVTTKDAPGDALLAKARATYGEGLDPFKMDPN